MKMIVITKPDGTVVGAMHLSEGRQPGGIQGGLQAGPGEIAREVDVPHDIATIVDGERLHDRLKAHIAKKP